MKNIQTVCIVVLLLYFVITLTLKRLPLLPSRAPDPSESRRGPGLLVESRVVVVGVVVAWGPDPTAPCWGPSFPLSNRLLLGLGRRTLSPNSLLRTADEEEEEAAAAAAATTRSRRWRCEEAGRNRSAQDRPGVVGPASLSSMPPCRASSCRRVAFTLGEGAVEVICHMGAMD